MSLTHLRLLQPLFILSLLLVLVACSVQPPSSKSSSTTSTPSGTSNSSNSEKPLIVGLVNMGDTSFNLHYNRLPDNSLTAVQSYPGSFRGVIINVTWAQLQPSPQAFDTSVIDQALSSITGYNQSHPNAPLLAKLRIWGSGHSPDCRLCRRAARLSVHAVLSVINV